MLFTKASEYALLSMILLAQSKSPKDVEVMSSELNISKSFLAKILQNLARDGILTSFKGANGGFILASNPKSISIKKILESAEKKRISVFECSNDKSDCPSLRSDTCKIWPMFNAVQHKVDDFLDTITLADIIKE